MSSVLQILIYAKANLNNLLQIDADKNDVAALACVPDVFVPISKGMIKAEDIKYVCARRISDDKDAIYQIIALKDFNAASGMLIKAGDGGGFVNVKTYLGHADNSWVDDTSVVFSSKITGESLIANGCEISNCVVKNSTIENSELKNAIRVENSHVKEVLAEESCSIIKSRVYDSILIDRAHVENSKILGSRLTFCNVVDSKVENETIIGDAHNLNMAKIYDYETIAYQVVKKTYMNSILDFFKNKKIH